MNRIITDELIEKYKTFLIEEEKSNATIEKYLYDYQINFLWLCLQ